MGIQQMSAVIPFQKNSESMVTIIDHATRSLAEARNSAELLEARGVAEAALKHAEVTKAAREVQGDCLRLIARAEMRLAEEVDKLPKNKGGGDTTPPKPGGVLRGVGGIPTVKELTGDHTARLAEHRLLASAGEDVVDGLIDYMVKSGGKITKTRLYKEAREAVPKSKRYRNRKEKGAHHSLSKRDAEISELNDHLCQDMERFRDTYVKVARKYDPLTKGEKQAIIHTLQEISLQYQLLSQNIEL